METNKYQGGFSFRLRLGFLGLGAVTLQNSGDTVTKTAHGLLAGDVVRFSAITGATNPVINKNYFVINPTTNTFQLAEFDPITGARPAVPTPIAIDADGTATSVDGFETLLGIRSVQFSLNSEEIDVTTQDDAQWKTLLDEAGISSVSVSGSGVFKDDFSQGKAQDLLIARARAVASGHGEDRQSVRSFLQAHLA
jgi:hypothetical protein